MEFDDLKDIGIPDDVLQRINDPEIVRRQIKEGKTFQDVLGYDQDAMNAFYSAARLLFQKEEFRKAADSFVFLTTLNPYVHTYWLGLGMSEQLSENYPNALLAYAMAILTDASDAVAHYHSGNCYRAMNDKENALQSYEMAIHSCLEVEGMDTIRAMAERAKEELA